MALISPNVRIWTSRPIRNVATGATSIPTPYLSSVKARIQNPDTTEFAVLEPQLAFKEVYKIVCRRGTDIEVGDTITKITELDGITLWPRTEPQNAVYEVRLARESSPVVLRNHVVYVEKIRVRGKVNPN